MKIRNFVMALLAVLVLSSCPDPLREPPASLTINPGSGSRAVTYPPDEATFARLLHSIELSGPSGEQQTHELSAGKSSITITLAPGTWEIIVGK